MVFHRSCTRCPAKAASRGDADSVVADIAATGGKAYAIQADVSKSEDVKPRQRPLRSALSTSSAASSRPRLSYAAGSRAGRVEPRADRDAMNRKAALEAVAVEALAALIVRRQLAALPRRCGATGRKRRSVEDRPHLPMELPLSRKPVADPTSTGVSAACPSSVCPLVLGTSSPGR
jgi:hypothetical protein